MLNLLNNLTRERACYLKFFKKLDENTKEVAINKEAFERETQVYGMFNYADFYNSGLFRQKHKLVDKQIVCDLY